MLSIAVLLTVSTFSWAEDVVVGNIIYSLDKDWYTAMVTGFDGDVKGGSINVKIPSTIKYEGTTYSVTSIGRGAFSPCSSLTSIEIPGSVKSIGDAAFDRCYSLTSVSLSEGLISIGDCAFRECSSLTSIDIPGSVTSIDNEVFHNCSSLRNVILREGVRSIGYAAFSGCFSLTSLEIPESMMSIGESAFFGCSPTEVKFASIESMCRISYCYKDGYEDYYSNPCSNGVENLYIGGEIVTSLVIPNTVNEIKQYAFRGCSSLTSIEIPSSVTSIGRSAFSFCSPTEVKFASIESMLDISYSSVSSNPCYNGVKKLYIGDKIVTSVTSLVIPNTVNKIGDYVFAGCPFEYIEIPNSVTSIGNRAFSNCGLCSIKIPNNVTSIGNYAFYQCPNLFEIEIPSSVTSIGSSAFEWCYRLSTVTCYAKNVPELDSNVFALSQISSIATLYVPATALADYKAADQWKDFGKILPIGGYVDGIDMIGQDADDSNVPYYTIDGKQIENPTQKGIYIRNGKKILVK